ncbi:MAG: cytochrome c [Solirubrobacterales bacterium]|nr:cytochrome c [Solirubrobacterales bacterium]
MRVVAITSTVIAIAFGLSACGFGEEGISVPANSPEREGAELFAANCSGCHTLGAAGAEGTGNRGTRVQGPNLDQRSLTREESLHAIQNGGASGAIMPQNIVVGDEADAVADFLAKYAGSEAGDK